MKTCKRCGQDKPIDSFTVDVRYKDGRYPWCFECRREWRQGRKDRQRDLHANWVEQNRDHVRTYGREYFQNNEAQRKRNREAGRAREKERWANDPAFRERKNRQKLRIYYGNPVHRKKHLANALINRRRRRARIQGAGTHYTQAEWQALCARYDHRCLCCRQQKPLTPDHVKPLSRGGSDDISNIQPLCLDCNLRKGTKATDYRPDGDGV